MLGMCVKSISGSANAQKLHLVACFSLTLSTSALPILIQVPSKQHARQEPTPLIHPKTQSTEVSTCEHFSQLKRECTRKLLVHAFEDIRYSPSHLL
mmetsp:Transcript_16533/g.47599  ORF Transcript_16533/g.47599 Transcript_16533/m.47599 type:complete len:96 (+) Transcript_16533:47-334(+)